MARQDTNNTAADLADLRGAWFVMTSETEEGQRLATGKLKRIMQGMGRIKATRKDENPIEFPETHKLWIDANHLPRVHETDDAIWNRLCPIPFRGGSQKRTRTLSCRRSYWPRQRVYLHGR